MSLKEIAQKMRETMSLSEIAEKASEAALVILSESLSGSKVTPDRLKRRYEVCSQCPNLRLLDSGELYCGYCKCPISVDRKVLNRALYSTVSCPDPSGDRWAKADC